MQYDPKTDDLVEKNESVTMFETIELYTGMNKDDIQN